MTTVAEVTEQSRRNAREALSQREFANLKYVLDKIEDSVTPLPYEGKTQGHYKSDDYLTTNVIDVEFPSYVQAVEWARDNAMVSEVTVVNPKASLSETCTLTFSLMGFITRGRNAE